jgi:hypothetical protein
MIMSLIIAILVLALLLYLLQLLPLDPTAMRILQIGVVVIALLWLVNRFGLATF